MRSVLAAACLASGLACAGRPPDHARWQVRFGPVIADEVVTGHATLGNVTWLATASDALMRIDLLTGTHARMAIGPLDAGEHTWGLAATRSGRLWSLIGRVAAGELGADGRIVRRLSLANPQVGVFAIGDELAFQPFNVDPPSHALFVGGEAGVGRPWGQMVTRRMPLVRGAVAALNLVACGGTSGEWIPCWFPDEAAVTLTNVPGVSVRLVLSDLPTVAREMLVASDNPRRPVRDAFALEDGTIWVLASGEVPPNGSPDRRGGWLLARYSRAARPLSRIALRDPCRLILAANTESASLLTWDGHVVEVRP